MTGIDQTKVTALAIIKLIMSIKKRLSDGFDATDIPIILVDLATDDDFRSALIHIAELPAEIRDLKLDEICDLIAFTISSLPKKD